MRSTNEAPDAPSPSRAFLALTERDLDGLVWDRWQRLADVVPDREAIVHLRAGEPPHRWTWGQLLETAPRIATHLHQAGVRRGDVCALIMRHHPLFYPIYMAVCALGALPAVLAYPNNRLHPEKFRGGLEGMARRSGLDWVLTERALEERIRPLLTRPDSTVKGLLFPLEWQTADVAPISRSAREGKTGGDPCLLQHSSGTTGLQKAVVLSHRAILQHIFHYGNALQIGPDDKIVSWLPLYHDMGLIAAFYLSLLSGIPIIQLDTFEWVTAPVLLLEAISAERGTMCWLPNFAFNLMADKVKDEDVQGLNLSSLRVLVNASEPIRVDSFDRFHRRFGAYGLTRDAFSACYGMAEVTMVATQVPVGREARQLSVDRDEVSQGRAIFVTDPAKARVSVSSGAAIPGCSLRVVDEAGENVPDLTVGQILIQSVSAFDGYRNFPERTAEVLRNGWVHSGDIGFRYEDEYYIIGRKKDIIIVGGKNLYPEDIEDAVSKVPDIIPGRVIAFGIDNDETGTEQVCVVAETREEDPALLKAIRLRVVQAIMAIDITVSRVYLAPPRWLIKSSAGKPARKANRDRALNELTWR